MTLRDLLKKKEKIRDDTGKNKELAASQDSPPPQVTFMRTDSNTQELISPPTFADDQKPQSTIPHEKKRFSRFRSSSNASAKSTTSNVSEKRLSSRLHLGSHSRSSSVGSANIPSDLPAITDEIGESEEKEAQWENRATILAQENPVVKESRSRENSVGNSSLNGGRPALGRHISDAKGDVRSIPMHGTKEGRWADARGQENIQEAIKLHEAGGEHLTTIAIKNIKNIEVTIPRSRSLNRHVRPPGRKQRHGPNNVRPRSPVRSPSIPSPPLVTPANHLHPPQPWLGHSPQPTPRNPLPLPCRLLRRQHRIRRSLIRAQKGGRRQRRTGARDLRAGE